MCEINNNNNNNSKKKKNKQTKNETQPNGAKGEIKQVIFAFPCFRKKRKCAHCLPKASRFTEVREEEVLSHSCFIPQSDVLELVLYFTVQFTVFFFLLPVLFLFFVSS